MCTVTGGRQRDLRECREASRGRDDRARTVVNLSAIERRILRNASAADGPLANEFSESVPELSPRVNLGPRTRECRTSI